jgi:hypothetical protein
MIAGYSGRVDDPRFFLRRKSSQGMGLLMDFGLVFR